MGTWTCTKCGYKWESDGECNRINNKPVCSDCYFEAMGDLVEKRPIGLPRRPISWWDLLKRKGKK